MRTFEQYINESRQNYIFGGTDDRNTNVDAKTFSELKPNDFVFAFDNVRNSNFGFNAWLVDGFYFSHKGGWKDLLKKLNAMDRTNYEVYRTYITTSLQDAEDKYKEMRRTSVKKVYVNVTNELRDDIMTIKEFKEKYVDKISESRKNYIFGGTDGRNTDITPLTFRELEKGDILYYYNSHERKMYALVFSEICKNLYNDKEYPDCIRAIYYSSKKPFNWSIAREELDLSMLYDNSGNLGLSTSKEELIDKMDIDVSKITIVDVA